MALPLDASRIFPDPHLLRGDRRRTSDRRPFTLVQTPVRWAFLPPESTRRIYFRIDMELNGRGNGWTDVTEDVIVGGSADGLTLDYGIRGNTPNDLVAGTGEMRFTLNNSATNSARLRGYYSPGHANCRSGFRMGIRVRCYFRRPEGEVRFKHVGRLVFIQPRAGTRLHSTTQCQTVDWMDEAARALLPPETPLQVSKRSDEIFSAILAEMAVQPDATEIQTGQDTYPYALDTERAQLTAMQAFNDLAASERSKIFVKGDTVQGGTLVYESRRTRALATSSVFTLTDISGLSAHRAIEDTYTKVQAIAHPRRVDTTNVVLFKLQSVPSVGPISTYFVLASYRDPEQEAARVGGTSVVDPVATTDYTMNSAADGSGTDLTSSFTVTADKGASGVRFTITNNSATTGYVTLLQIRGKGIYDFENITAEATDATEIATVGEQSITLDLKYQTDFTTADEIAHYVLEVWKTATTMVGSVTFHASAAPALIDQAIRREISDRVVVREEVTAIDRDYYINAIRLHLSAQHQLYCTWVLEPADVTSYWFLEVTGKSELGQTTRLGFGLVVGHTDIAHGDTHTDVAHSDTPHSDTHTDEHTDSAHGDSAHTDVAHSDIAHSDSHSDVGHSDIAHADSAHSDSHSDVAHTDAAHSDSHSDVPHLDDPFQDVHNDVGHGDSAHQDVGHDDSHGDDHQDFHEDESHEDGGGHADTHEDTHDDSHSDTAHSDVGHSDSSHGDSHTDEAHEDGAHSDSHSDSHGDVAHSDSHGDTAHADTAHSDVAHSDSHTDVSHSDTAHQDVGHTDQAHVDTHSDVAHSDVLHSDTAHEDTHTDTAHGDAT